MVRAPLLQLSDISLGFGPEALFAGLDLVVQPGDRLALVGRNGAGKSTLMRLMAGLVQADRGAAVTGVGVSVSYLEQDPDMAGCATLGDFACKGLEASEAFRVERVAQGLKFDPGMAVATASGGERRRAALAGVLAGEPGLMLLDEPTNHLDIEAIGWLEGRLLGARAAFVLISHDRAFLRSLTTGTLWIDRGMVRRRNMGFAGFEDWRDKVWAEEDLNRHKLDRLIKSEGRWAVEGISARRKRNQGRVRALEGLRAERAGMIRRQGAAGMAFAAGLQSGKRVIEAVEVSKSFAGQAILRGFSVRLVRGERVAIVGPNGVGKTTLLQVLTGVVAPDAGVVKLGSNVAMVSFDQDRSGLMADKSLWENLTGDREMAVSGKVDQIMVRGRARHVVGYLKEFLFSETQARAPVRSLSGGEKSRLLLARLMARKSNLLVLDEPTNDLDLETLDLLQELLAEYDGTVLFVSHDRDFIDRVATSTIAMEGDGRVVIYAGGWSDYQSQRRGDAPKMAAAKSTKAKAVKTANVAKGGLSFTEQHRLDGLPAEIARLEAEIAKLADLLADAQLYARDRLKFAKASAALVARQTALGAAESEWLALEERASEG